MHRATTTTTALSSKLWLVVQIVLGIQGQKYINFANESSDSKEMLHMHFYCIWRLW